MTKAESLRRFSLERYLILSLGFTADEAAALRRISLTLRRWYELECGTDGGCIERNEATGKPYWLTDSGRRWTVADRETGALRRLARIVDSCNKERTRAGHEALNYYVQTDPRGAALYILRPGDVPEGSKADECYSRGVCVY
jgi:hypothetical protein